MKQIENKEDVILLVNTFYEEVQQNDILSPIFNDIAKVNWDTHLPTMYNFWASILLNEHSYSGNPMVEHILLSKKTTMGEIQFNEWLTLFNKTLDELFYGEKAEVAKERAQNIARLMQYKIDKANTNK